jgi:hypothetical protein
MTAPSITENLRYDDLSGGKTPACVLSVRYMCQHRRLHAVCSAAQTLQEIAITVHDMATSSGRASAMLTHGTQLASGPTAQSFSLIRWDT